MRLTPEGLAAHLKGALLPVYVLSGDEPLLMLEAADALRRAARTQGYAEREIWQVERGGPGWDEIVTSANALSLFASKRVLELRLASGKPGSGAEALRALLKAAGPELLLLIITGKLDQAAQGAEWLAEAQRLGAWLPIWPVEAARFPAWLRQRFDAAGLKADEAAIELLVARTEGNLLAAQQEVEKLALQLPAGSRIGVRDVAASSGESARYSVFQLMDVVTAGDLSRSLRILHGLRADGTEATLVQWGLVRALHRLQGAGGRRLPFARLTARALRSDRMAKGQLRGEPWDELQLLATELCGRQLLPVTRSLWRS